METQEKMMEAVGRKTINDVPFRIHSYMDELSTHAHFIMLDSDILLCIKPLEDSIQFLTKNDDGVYVTMEEANCYRPTRRHMQLVMNGQNAMQKPNFTKHLNNLDGTHSISFEMNYLLKE